MHCCELSTGGMTLVSKQWREKESQCSMWTCVSTCTCTCMSSVLFGAIFCEFAERFFLNCNSYLWCTCIWEVYAIQYCQLDATYLPLVFPSYDSVSLQVIICVITYHCSFTIL